MPVSDSEDKPVVNGLVALVAVAVVVGLLAGIALMIGTKMLGVGGGDGGDGGPAAGESLVLPDPSRTTRQSDPLITLLPSDDDGAESDSASASNEPKATKKAKPKAEISLTQGAFRASPGEDLYLSGIYPQGEGAVLDVQIRVNAGSWADFPVDVNVSDATFSTYVNTSQTGDIEWRVVDKSKKLTSNAVKVTYG